MIRNTRSDRNPVFPKTAVSLYGHALLSVAQKLRLCYGRVVCYLLCRLPCMGDDKESA